VTVPDGFPLPPLVKFSGPIGQPLPLLPGQDRVNWWAYTSETTFIAVPPEVVDEMVSHAGDSVWNSLRGETPIDSLDRVRLQLNVAAERLEDGGQ
jgi:hypothetical protein